MRSCDARPAFAACLAPAMLLASGGIPLRGEDPPRLGRLILQHDDITELRERLVPKSVVVSPDGKRFGGLFLRGEKQVIFVNDQEFGEWDGVVKDSLRFSADSRRFGFGAVRGEQNFVVIDGQEYPAFDGCAQGTPIFSPDGNRFATFARHQGGIVVIVDGVASKPWDSLEKESLTFSSDSRHFAYLAKDGQHARVVVDGVPGARFRNVAGFAFSPNGRHFAYIAFSTTQMILVVDGREAVTAENFISDSMAWDDDTRLHVLMLEGSQVTRVQVDYLEAPEGVKATRP